MEVFGSVMTAVELIQKTKSNLERAKRVGKTVKTLRFTLNRLMELEDEVDPIRDRDLLVEVKELVDETTELILKNRTSKRQALAFFWDSSVDADVQRINSSLSVIYASLSRRIQTGRHGSVGSIGRLTPELHSISSFGKSPPESHCLNGMEHRSPRLEPLSQSNRRESTTSIHGSTIPCNLSLKDANHNDIRQPIRLDRLCVTETNAITKIRILQYETSDHAIIVTHEIPYGTIPCTPDDLETVKVFFLESHLVTVETRNEFAVFKLNPVYVFDTPHDTIAFMNMARERTLVGSFKPKKITKASSTAGGFLSKVLAHDELLARNKVVRIWLRQEENIGPVVTLTFHDRTKTRLTQWALEDFAERPLFTDKNKGVELSRLDHGEQFVFLFEDDIEAASFAEAMNKRRRSSSTTSGTTSPPSYRIMRKPLPLPMHAL